MGRPRPRVARCPEAHASRRASPGCPSPQGTERGERVVPWLRHPITLLPAPGPRVGIPKYPQTVSAALLCASQPWPLAPGGNPLLGPQPRLSKRFEHLWVRDRSKKHRCLRKRGADRTGLGQRLRPRHSEWGVCAACERELAGGVNRVLEQSPPGAPRAGGQTRGE